MHFCNMVQIEPHYGSSKILMKPVQYCSFAQNGLKTALMRFSIFLRFHKIMSNGLRGLPRSARRPHGWPPILPTSIKINVNKDKIMQDAVDSIVLFGFRCIPQDSMDFIAFHSILWISLDSLGFYGFHWILQESMDFIAFRRILWISLDSLRFCGFHWIPTILWASLGSKNTMKIIPNSLKIKNNKIDWHFALYFICFAVNEMQYFALPLALYI